MRVHTLGGHPPGKARRVTERWMRMGDADGRCGWTMRKGEAGRRIVRTRQVRPQIPPTHAYDKMCVARGRPHGVVNERTLA